MIDLKNETPISLAQGARMLPPGRRGKSVTLSCLLRWILKGVKLLTGETIRLEAARMGGRWITSVEALERFAVAQTPRLGELPPPRTPGQRQRAADHAGRALEKAGI